MAEIKKVWVVTDPTPESEMVDILYGTDLPGFINYLRGSNRDDWKKENSSLYDNEAEATADAKKRMKKRDADQKKTASDRVLSRFLP